MTFQLRVIRKKATTEIKGTWLYMMIYLIRVQITTTYYLYISFMYKLIDIIKE